MKCVSKKGVTLLELVIVLTIIGILASVSIPTYMGYLEKTKYTTAISDIGVIDEKLNEYYARNGCYPESLADIGMNNKLDPWGNSYRYYNITTSDDNGKVRKDHSQKPLNSDFDLYSMGPDGKSDSPITADVSYDDVVRANDGGFIGKASNY